MNAEPEVESLIDSLRRLYTKIARRVWHERMISYRRHGGVDAGGDIASSLSDYIQKTAEAARQASAHRAESAAIPDTVQPTRHHPATATHEPQGEQEQEQPPVKPGELSKHFGTSRAGPGFDPHVGADLKKRTWEHIHATLRHASQGQPRRAKLHADLASSAFKEAAHYLPDEEIAELAAEIEKKLKSVTEHKPS